MIVYIGYLLCTKMICMIAVYKLNSVGSFETPVIIHFSFIHDCILNYCFATLKMSKYIYCGAQGTAFSHNLWEIPVKRV